MKKESRHMDNPRAVFKQMPRGNWVAQGEGFYISFNGNPKENADANGLGELVDMFGALVGEGNSDAETAVYDRETGIWRILKGDFCDHYAPVIHLGLSACIVVYEQFKRQYRSGWSTDDECLLPSPSDTMTAGPSGMSPAGQLED